MNADRTKLVRILVRTGVGALLVVAGLLKLARPAEFYADLLAYAVPLPGPTWPFLAVTFPWLELIVGAAFAFGLWPETTGVLAVGLAFVFVGMLGQAIVRGLDIRCGCFGPVEAGLLHQPWVAFIRAVLILIAALWLLLSEGPATEAGDPSRRTSLHR